MITNQQKLDELTEKETHYTTMKIKAVEALWLADARFLLQCRTREENKIWLESEYK